MLFRPSLCRSFEWSTELFTSEPRRWFLSAFAFHLLTRASVAVTLLLGEAELLFCGEAELLLA